MCNLAKKAWLVKKKGRIFNLLNQNMNKIIEQEKLRKWEKMMSAAYLLATDWGDCIWHLPSSSSSFFPTQQLSLISKIGVFRGGDYY